MDVIQTRGKAAMTDVTPEILDSAAARLPQMLADVQRLVEVETPSEDKAAVARGAAEVAALTAERLGVTPET
ncbi:hypothetical protein, partial [Bacillus pumilus]|uniref:hypothetical protein n=1 Tax=Bacillus pumilus TaxID=1408 RepID=UPI003CF97726